MMPFYESLAPYYDQIFPLNEDACSFLLSHFDNAKSILDIGAGTGSMAIALAQKGLNVIAVEPDETMAEYIHQKSTSNRVSVAVYIKDMQQIDQVIETVDGMYCIGNTLAHLNNLEEVEAFIKKCYETLNKGGTLIFQLVNYDKVLSDPDFSFPTIKRDTLTFTRQYKQDEEKIFFSTNLTINRKSFANTTSLYPVTSTPLISILKNVGFQLNHLYGNFKLKDYTMDSPALIIVAKKDNSL